jgi:hypothetical protein
VWAANKKLLAPFGSQESSEPIKCIGPVMANSIAFAFQQDFIGCQLVLQRGKATL